MRPLTGRQGPTYTPAVHPGWKGVSDQALLSRPHPLPRCAGWPDTACRDAACHRPGLHPTTTWRDEASARNLL